MADSTPPGNPRRHAPPRWRSEKARHLFLVYTRPVAEKRPPIDPARRQPHTLPASDTLLASFFSSYLEFVKRPEALSCKCRATTPSTSWRLSRKCPVGSCARSLR